MDDDFFEYLNQWNWSAKKDGNTGNFYPARHDNLKPGRPTVFMHRQIMGTGRMKIDRNTLNNQRYNLREVTDEESARNQRAKSTNKSGYKGVSWRKQVGKWTVQIHALGKQICIGNYDDVHEASIAYNQAALKYYGEFAVLNIIRNYE